MSNKRIKIAIVGVGNCASSLVQGLTYYKNASSDTPIVGLMHTILGGYTVSDIDVVAAFDVNKKKVGLDLSDAIFALPNNTKKFSTVEKTGIIVQNSHVLDGIGTFVQAVIPISNAPIPDPAHVLKKTGAEILVCYLPVGSQQATEYWAEICLKSHVAMVNCLPVFIASNPIWAKKFVDAGVPIIGDDIKSQVGATIVHRTLTNLFLDRGMPIDNTYQLNVGGNTDFQNMLERTRLTSKKLSKTRSVTSQVSLRNQTTLKDEHVHIGPSDHVPWLNDNKVAFIRIESRHFGDVPMHVEVRLSVEDSPNSAGVVTDAIRCLKVALDRKLKGPLEAASAYFMKSPPKQMTDVQAHDAVEAFIS